MFQRLGLFLLALPLLFISVNGFGQLSADFEVIYVTQCPPGVLNFVNKSSGFTSCKWVFGNGNSSENKLDTLNQVYPDPGNYSVTLTVSDGGQEKTVTKSVRIFKEPKANFTTNISKGCVPMKVTFTESATIGDAEITEYYWDFRNGVVIIDTDPTMTYNNIGEYDILLRVTDANGCINFIEKEKYIKTYPQPSANFSAVPPFACDTPATINFTNKTSSQLNVNYSWDFGNGKYSVKESPENIYGNTGTFNVKLKAYNNSGCIDSITRDIAIEKAIKSSFEIYTQEGDIVNSGDTICDGDYILKNTTTPSDLSHWKINGGRNGYSDSLQYNFSNKGWYTIQLVPNISGGCMETVEKKVFINKITADFEFSEIKCDFPLTVNFTNKTTDAVSYNWDLPQGNNSNSESPQIALNDVYAANDYINRWPDYVYNAKLTVTNKTGCVDSLRKEIVFKHPQAKLTADKRQGCIPLDINFTDTSASELPVIEKAWVFGDGSTSNLDEHNNLYTYKNSGDFKAKLILKNEKGCLDTSSVFVVRAGKKLSPDFEYTPSRICYNDSIEFTDRTPESHLVDYWSYTSSANIKSACEKDPSPKLGANARTTGYHDLSLEVGYNGCVTQKTIKNAVYVRGPIASFTHQIDCSDPREVPFNSSLDLVSSFEWSFGDGITDNTDKNPVHNFTSGGDYVINLKVSNDTTGCVHEAEKTVKIREIEASFDCDTIACVGEYLSLDASASNGYINECYLEGFRWDFDDDSAPLRTYKKTKDWYCAERGKFDIELIVTDINGCSDTVTKSIQVFQPDPTFSVDSSSGCAPDLSVIFENTSTDTTIKSFKWIFGDGHTLEDVEKIQHHYKSDFEYFYNSRLVAYDTHGCSNSIEKRIDIFKPNASFSSDEQYICKGKTLSFNASYQNADSSYWQFGNGPFMKQDKEFTFNETGFFTIKHLIFKDNCTDSLVRKNYISVEEASAKIIASDTIAECYPQTILFSHINEGDGVAVGLWDFDFKGHTSPGYSDSVYFSYSLPGEFYPKLSVRTKNGCTDTASLKIMVKGPYAEYEISDKHPCKSEPVTFKMTVEKDVNEQLWDYGDGVASIEKEPTYVYSSVDTFITSLTISDINGCTPPAIYDTIFMIQVKSDFSFPKKDTAFCVFEILNPENNSIGGERFVWKLDENIISDQFNLTNLSFSNSGEHKLSLETHNDDNCSDTAHQKIIVYPLPEITATATDSICRGIEKAYLVAHGDSAYHIEWSPATIVEEITRFSTSATPEYTTTFTVTATDSIGCINSSSVDVYVHQFPEILRQPASDTTILLGEKIQLLVNSNYLSRFSWDFEEGTGWQHFDTLVVKPLKNTTYTVNIEDVCFKNTEEFIVNVREIYTVELPDVFTPNGDGINDRIYVKGGGIKELLEFKVFNRYGNLVYYSNDINEGWDGYYKGKRQNSDVYTYFVRIITYENEEVIVKGTFNLVY